MATKKTTKKKTAKKKTAKKKTAKRLPTPAVQVEVPGAEDERHKYNAALEPKASEYCDMLQQQETWRKKAKKAKPALDDAMDAEDIDEYYTAKGHRVVRKPGALTTTVTLKKDDDGIMEESDDDGPTVTTITVGE